MGFQKNDSQMLKLKQNPAWKFGHFYSLLTLRDIIISLGKLFETIIFAKAELSAEAHLSLITASLFLLMRLIILRLTLEFYPEHFGLNLGIIPLPTKITLIQLIFPGKNCDEIAYTTKISLHWIIAWGAVLSTFRFFFEMDLFAPSPGTIFRLCP